MIRPPSGMGAFQFVVLAGLRAAQLTRGCTPKVDGDHTPPVMAQREIAEGKVTPTQVDVDIREGGATASWRGSTGPTA